MAQQNTIEYFLFASAGNATDFGDLVSARGSGSGFLSDGIRGVLGGGQDAGGLTTIMDRIVMASTGNATDFGDLTLARHSIGTCSSNIRGVYTSGIEADSPYWTDTMDYITIATVGNATDFGNLAAVKNDNSGASGD